MIVMPQLRYAMLCVFLMNGWHDSANAAPPSDPKSPVKSPPAIQVEAASWEQTLAIISQQKGKVVVLDLWSTWCEPCVKEFPALVTLQEKYPNDIVCISLNCNYIGNDELEEERQNATQFVVRQKARFRHLISSDADEKLYEKVGIASIPVVRVYDRAGKLSKQFDNEKDEYGEEGFTYQKHISPYVANLVTE